MQDNRNIYGRTDMVSLDMQDKIYGSLGMGEQYLLDTSEGKVVNMIGGKGGTFKKNVTEYNIYGKSTQQTTTGAQLFDLSKVQTALPAIEVNEESAEMTIQAWGVSLRPSGTSMIPSLKPSTKYYARATITMLENVSAEDVASATTHYKNKRLLIYRDSSAEEGGYSANIANTEKDMADGESVTVTSSFTTPENLNNLRIMVYSEYVVTQDGRRLNAKIKVSDLMISESLITDATPYEPYTGGKPSPSPEYPQPITSAGDKGNIVVDVTDGAERSQSVILSIPNGLRGIPVKSGGNYIDANGQQWVADSIEYRGGKVYHVQRVWSKTFRGNDISFAYIDKGFVVSNILPFTSERREYLCTQASMKTALYGDYTLWIGVNNTTVYFISTGFEDAENPTNGLIAYREHLDQHPVTVMTYFDDPIETEITGEEAESLKALYTYDGTTVVENDEELWQKITYKQYNN